MDDENILFSVFDHLCGNLRIVIDQIKDGETVRPEDVDFNLETFWNRFGFCVRAVSQEATKLCLACSEPPLPSCTDVQPLVNGIEQSVLTLVSAYYSLPVSRGQTLRKYVTESVVGLVEAMHGLVASFKSGEGGGSQKHLQSTGNIWEICDKFPKLPKDNREAVLLRTKEVDELISDALEELEETLRSRSEENKNGIEDRFEVLDLDDDEDDMRPVWSESDRSVVTACVGLVKTAKAATKRLSKAVEVDGRCGEKEMATELDDVAERSATLSPAVDDLVSCLYPPVRLDSVAKNSNRLVSELRSLLECVEKSHFTGNAGNDSSWVEFLRKALEHNATKVQKLVST